MDYTQVIIRPLLTEKTTLLKDLENKVVFQIAPGANRIEVKRAVEDAFKVKVEKVRILNKKPTMRKRFGKHLGKKAAIKKAYVKLAPGQKIDFFEGV